MSTPNRGALLTKTHRVLKKQYKAAALRGEHDVLETLLFGCCLENAHWEAAERAFSSLRSAFFDWNEIRVSTAKELAEVMSGLPEPEASATRVKGILQTVFESNYSFDLEPLKKQNLGQAVKRMQKLDSISPFVVSYATQVALGGHSIPLDRGALGVLHVLGVISHSESAAGTAPGLERAIPKSRGMEFGLLLHELGADFVRNPFAPQLRDFLLSISPDAKDRFPKRKKPAQPEPEPKPEPKSSAKKPAAKVELQSKKKPLADKRQPTKAPAAAAKKKPAEPAKKTPSRHITKRRPR